MKILHSWKNWSLGRTIFLIAGIFTALGVILGLTIHCYFFYFSGFVGLMQITFALTGFCPMMLILKKLGFRWQES
jgi:hypothetical protein